MEICLGLTCLCWATREVIGGLRHVLQAGAGRLLLSRLLRWCSSKGVPSWPLRLFSRSRPTSKGESMHGYEETSLIRTWFAAGAPSGERLVYVLPGTLVSSDRDDLGRWLCTRGLDDLDVLGGRLVESVLERSVSAEVCLVLRINSRGPAAESRIVAGSRPDGMEGEEPRMAEEVP